MQSFLTMAAYKQLKKNSSSSFRLWSYCAQLVTYGLLSGLFGIIQGPQSKQHFAVVVMDGLLPRTKECGHLSDWIRVRILTNP